MLLVKISFARFECLWIFKVGMRFLMQSISNDKQSNLLQHFLPGKISNCSHSVQTFCRNLQENFSQLPTICVQPQRVQQ